METILQLPYHTNEQPDAKDMCIIFIFLYKTLVLGKHGINFFPCRLQLTEVRNISNTFYRDSLRQDSMESNNIQYKLDQIQIILCRT